MKVNYQERIETTITELKIIMAQRRELYLARQKVHALYLLKCGSSPSIRDVAELLGVDRITVQKWLKQYNEGGLSSLLKLRRSKGRVRVISSQVIAEISTKISEESCQFKSYKKIALWGENNNQVSVRSQILHKQLHYRIQAKLKRPKRVSNKKESTAASLKKLEKLLKVVLWLESNTPNPAKNSLKYGCQDETRIGLRTI